jgi:hypothetical protein
MVMSIVNNNVSRIVLWHSELEDYCAQKHRQTVGGLQFTQNGNVIQKG